MTRDVLRYIELGGKLAIRPYRIDGAINVFDDSADAIRSFFA